MTRDRVIKLNEGYEFEPGKVAAVYSRLDRLDITVVMNLGDRSNTLNHTIAFSGPAGKSAYGLVGNRFRYTSGAGATKNMNIVVKAAEGQEAVGIYTNELDLRNTPHGKEIPFPCISWRMPRCMKRRGCSSWGIIMRWR